MKIHSANVYLVNAGRLHPVIVELFTDEGITGIGEAAIAYGVGGTAAAGKGKELGAPGIGGGPSPIEAVWAGKGEPSFLGKGGGPSGLRAHRGHCQAPWWS